MNERATPPSLALQSFRVAASAMCVVALALLLWYGSGTVLLAFAGVLLAIVFRSAAELVSKITGLGPRWSLALALLGLAGVAATAAVFIGPRIAAQVDDLRDELPRAWQGAQTRLRGYGWGRELLDRLPAPDTLVSGKSGINGIMNVFSTTLSILGAAIIVGFLGLYFAIDPGLYRRGILKLVPADKEKRCGEVLERIGEQLRFWLLGKLALMAFVGIFTAIGLWVLKMPLVISLACLAALLDFIPNIGPILSAVPALLLASTGNSERVLWVIVLYFAVQIVESYILQPLVQQRAVALPPSVTLLTQVLIGTLFGWSGLILATPMAVVAMNAVQMLYVEDTLGKA